MYRLLKKNLHLSLFLPYSLPTTATSAQGIPAVNGTSDNEINLNLTHPVRTA